VGDEQPPCTLKTMRGVREPTKVEKSERKARDIYSIWDFGLIFGSIFFYIAYICFKF
jgi:hypothetical protein